MHNRIKNSLQSGLSSAKTGFFFWQAENKIIEPEPALRSELFSGEQMENYGWKLASRHKLAPNRLPDRLLERLQENEILLSECCKRFSAVNAVSKVNQLITPAGQWLLDNYWLVEEQIHATRKNMPKGYLANLPQLDPQSSLLNSANMLSNNTRTSSNIAGKLNGIPRIYDLALENISHGDGHLDMKILARFIGSYQTVSALKLGELWALPLMLRLALIENLRRVSTRILASWRDQNLAIKWAEQLIQTVRQEKKSVVLIVADMAASHPPMSSAFVAELDRRLKGQNNTLNLPLTWIEEMLTPFGISIEQLIQQDTQQQAADQVSVSNSLNSLRLLSAQNWHDFVEDISLVEKILQADPAQIYSQMDFLTRDHYRHRVEHLARKFNLSEQQVAAYAIELAQTAFNPNQHESGLYPAGQPPSPPSLATSPKTNVKANQNNNSSLYFSLQTNSTKIPEHSEIHQHVGFYLIDGGLAALKKTLALNSPGVQKDRIRELLQVHEEGSLPLYLGITLGLTLLFIWPFFNILRQNDWSGLSLALALIPALFTTSQLAVKLVNWQASMLVAPHFMPRLDFSKGIPDDNRTLVVIPTMLDSEQDVFKLLDKLEVHFLANRDKNLQFGLLTDFKDANQEILPEDAQILQLAKQEIATLNAKYPNSPNSINPASEPKTLPDSVPDTFFLCHRSRLWNEAEGVWMGYERKRGKLCEFNALLAGKGHDRFMLIAGNTLNLPPSLPTSKGANSNSGSHLAPVRYVITLDTDTQLPRETAMQLVGSMAHPLNRPVYDPAKKRIISGYTIMQPRVGVSVGSANRSNYAEIFCTTPGIDPYTMHVSDIYQDLFRQGSFVGKGIYDLEAFERAVGTRFPENSILSHDLIEGCFARAALVSDVILIENFPTTYLGDVQRRHRWIRGDWQLLPWLLPVVPKANGSSELNPLSPLSFWKMLDNLRRSMVSPALMLFLILGWFGTNQPLFWTVAVLSLIYALPVFDFILTLLHKPAEISYNRHVEEAVNNLFSQLLRTSLLLIWLPFEAYYSLDAILRTLWRLIISKKHRLQWNPSADAERTSPNTLAGIAKKMWFCPAWAIFIAALMIYAHSALVPAVVFSIAWFFSPVIAWRMGKPKARKQFEATSKQKNFLQALSRRTWAFFEHYVCAEDNWLPPDNIQEQPSLTIAHRTSSTNIGMSLLAHLAAHDFGYLSASRLLSRLNSTFASMAKLERQHGHFYNWYDTKTLKPLYPRYISAVDSGNLAGHLLTLRAGLLELPDKPVFNPQIFAGILDTINVLMSELKYKHSTHKEWQELKKNTLKACSLPVKSLREAAGIIEELITLAKKLEQPNTLTPGSEAAFWLNALIVQLEDYSQHLYSLLLPQGSIDKDSALNLPSLRNLANLNILALPKSTQQEGEQVKLTACSLIERAQELANQAANFAQMDFAFLYDKQRNLLSIGFNLEENRLDQSYYDLLASEARLAYFVAISLGQIPQASWFALGRLLTSKGRRCVLLSWSGSMFEYLMPNLVMPSFEGTLLDDTCRGAVDIQIAYGRKLNLPWGISESGFNIMDSQYNYQYQAFGVPGLGLKRGLAEDLVIAPYASTLALTTTPGEACKNLQKLADSGMIGRYGMYEAVDHTPLRLPRNKDAAIIYSFMAHHQGMSLLALEHLLLNQPMQQRFVAEPLFKASLLLLEERIPKLAPDHLQTCNYFVSPVGKLSAKQEENKMRIYTNPDSTHPAVQLLSNGSYHVMVSSGGGGYSRYQGMDITRWQEDSTRDNWGQFCYVRECKTGEYWSTTLQPSLKPSDSYEAIFCDAKAEFRTSKNDFEIRTEIVVSPEDDVELRHLKITNRSRQKRCLELTSYLEVVLADARSDAQHPAFSKLFVQSDLVDEMHGIICTRRPRSKQEAQDAPRPFMFHLLAAHGIKIKNISYETDRARFIGRGRTLANPIALDEKNHAKLSNTFGAVLDPVAAIRCHVELEPGQTANIDLITGVASSRAICLELMEKFRDQHLAHRVCDLAWTHCQVQLHQFNASPLEARMYEQMAGSIIYPSLQFRAERSILEANTQDQSHLWGQSISGDMPIVLLRIADAGNIDLVAQLIKAHAYWRMKGLKTDLVIWNQDDFSYRQTLHDQIIAMIPSGAEQIMDTPGGIFVRTAQQLSREDQIMIQSAARLIISDSNGSLTEQVYRHRAKPQQPRLCPFVKPHQQPTANLPKGKPRVKPGAEQANTSANWQKDLILSTPGNAYGGFSSDGREYVIQLKENENLPAPWVNVLSNPNFGSIISESGSSYTWRDNAQQFRLTPWMNDPVSDSCGEAFYLRDEESGHYWSPSPWPCRGSGSYTIRHGFGYSVFEHEEDGIKSQLTVFVAQNEPVKFWKLKLLNHSGRDRRLSITGYVEWILGDLRSKAAMYISTESDRTTGAIFARNPYTLDYPGRVAFFDVDLPSRSISGDRAEFIGRNNSLAQPTAMQRECLSGRTGAGLDPCGAIQSSFELDDKTGVELMFVLGCTNSQDESVKLNQQFSNLKTASAELGRVKEHWAATLSRVQVKTPDPALDVLTNGWLMYQTIACRFQARSGFYQSGGAFGFRDQLQDCLAIMHSRPELVREHILTSASRQFAEGDVLHWWHPPLNRGVRTRCSDDYLWLPMVVANYIKQTGDIGILDEQVPYIETRQLNAKEESFYHLPMPSHLNENVYQHCVRAIKKGLPRGEHGLPLMGGGDWNDGMNMVGIEGQGESVWLGFFQYKLLHNFAEIALARGEKDTAKRCQEQCTALRKSLETQGWDGEWYRRAYFDDGTPLGSKQNQECRIDSIAQSWSVISGAAPYWRQKRAMQALDDHLVRRDIGIIQLLQPPFNKSPIEPGYIKGYLPGVRENGGQYTHAAIWAIMAFAMLGQRNKAWELFDLINPVQHGKNRESANKYKVEPYVMSADVYSIAADQIGNDHNHLGGRGGWSWLTGASGWMYKLILEHLLGVTVEGEYISLNPLMPAHWAKFSLNYRYADSNYQITVHKIGENDEERVTIDGQTQPGTKFKLVNDENRHEVSVYCKNKPEPES